MIPAIFTLIHHPVSNYSQKKICLPYIPFAGFAILCALGEIKFEN